MTTVIWIDWYSYHVCRFRALSQHESFKGQLTGIELVGGCGVHAGLKFRDDNRAGLSISSLFPERDWHRTGQLKLAGAVWRKLQELRPAVVLIPGFYTLPCFVAALWAKVHGKRSILMSETNGDDHRRVWWKETPKRFLTRTLFHYGIVGGKPHARYLCQLGLTQDRIARFYDVVDNNFYANAADEARHSPGLRESLRLPQKFFLYVGRIAPEKNVRGLLEAFKEYAEQGGTWSLLLVGDGADRALLEKETQKAGLEDRVQFTGLKRTSEITPYYAFAGCFVLPSTREPWGLVVNEAMASGLPVLVSKRCGCAEDLIDPGANGYLFDPYRPSELVSRMLDISTASQTKLAAMGRRSSEMIARYSPQHWAAEVARLVRRPS